jgi:hypothetical protein
MIVIEENAFSILERRLNRIEDLILDIKGSDDNSASKSKTPTKKKSIKTAAISPGGIPEKGGKNG